MRVAVAGIGVSAAVAVAVAAGLDDSAAVFELDDDAAAIKLIAFSVKPAVKLVTFVAEAATKPGVDAGAVAMTFACGLAAFGFDLAGCFQFPCTDGYLVDRAPRMECGRGEHHAHVLGIAQRHPRSLGVGLIDPGTRLRGVDPLRHKLCRRNDHLKRDFSAAHVDAVLDHEANGQLEALD